MNMMRVQIRVTAAATAPVVVGMTGLAPVTRASDLTQPEPGLALTLGTPRVNGKTPTKTDTQHALASESIGLGALPGAAALATRSLNSEAIIIDG